MPKMSERYIGKIGRNFKTKYNENIHDIRGGTSKFAKQTLKAGHSYGTLKRHLRAYISYSR
jgi:hypothetical protein